MSITIPKSAMVFAAGFGKRMQPVTAHTPKPLVEVQGKPMIEYGLNKLAQTGVSNVVVNTHYLAEKVEKYTQSYKRLNIKISHEEEILDTGGGLLHALPMLENDSPIFVINGDIICLDGPQGNHLKRLAQFYKPHMDCLLLLKRVGAKDCIGYDGTGDFDLTSNQQLLRKTAPEHNFVYTGIQILHPRILKNSELRPFSINWLYGKALQKDGKLNNMYGLIHDGPWLHIGTVDTLNVANNFLLNNNSVNPEEGW